MMMLSTTFRGCCRQQQRLSQVSLFQLSKRHSARSVLHVSTAPHLQSARFLSQSPKAKAESSLLQRFLAPKEMPPRNTFAWYREMTLICTVFAITGTSTMMLVRPAVKNVLHLEGSMKEGPWSYRIASLVIMSPIYSVLLVIVGTVFGRHAYFRFFSIKMLSRFGIPPEMLDKEFHATKKTFKKW